MNAFSFFGELYVAGWWGPRPGRPAVGGAPTAHMKQSNNLEFPLRFPGELFN